MLDPKDKWQVVFYQTARGEELVRKEISQLNDKHRAKIYLQIGLLKEHGLNLPWPYLKKLAGTKSLWELRISVYRIFLSPLSNKRILLLHMISKKTPKTPKQDLKLAEQRLKDYLKGS